MSRRAFSRSWTRWMCDAADRPARHRAARYFTWTTACVADGGQVVLLAVLGADLDEREGGVAGGDGLEGQRADGSLPVDTAGAGRTRGGDGDGPLPSSRWTSATGWPSRPSRSPASTLTSCKHLGVELHLQRNAEEVVRVGER